VSAVLKSLLLACVVVTSAVAELPTQSDIFAIASFTPSTTNYVSADYIFSALPFYQFVPEGERITDYPSHKEADTQQGALVLHDKTVLFFYTRSPKYLSVVDSTNDLKVYRLAKRPPSRRICPKPPPEINALPFPKPDDVFCVATLPWNPAKHFTPQSFIEALSRFRPLTEQDVPTKAIWVSSNTGKRVYPKEWDDAQHEKHPEPLSGVLVLNNRAVLKWTTWTPHAIGFTNYRYTTYFVVDE